MRDDRVLPATWWTALLVTPILVVAGIILFFFPGDTEDLWAWPIDPPLTALAVGGGYLSGAVFFARAVAARRWHVMALGFPAASVLTVLLLAATVLHWDRFSHDHPAFWAWLVIYVVTPVLLPALWFANRRYDPGIEEHAGPTVPDPVRRAVGAVGAVQLVVALAFFARPSLAADTWPWPLSPLTARTISAFLAFIAVLLLSFLVERRWSALALLVDSAALGLALVAIGVARSPEDLTGTTVANAVFVVLLVGAVVALAAVRLTVPRRPAPADLTRSGAGPPRGSRHRR
jgi:hypothetical protein